MGLRIISTLGKSLAIAGGCLVILSTEQSSLAEGVTSAQRVGRPVRTPFCNCAGEGPYYFITSGGQYQFICIRRSCEDVPCLSGGPGTYDRMLIDEEVPLEECLAAAE